MRNECFAIVVHTTDEFTTTRAYSVEVGADAVRQDLKAEKSHLRTHHLRFTPHPERQLEKMEKAPDFDDQHLLAGLVALQVFDDELPDSCTPVLPQESKPVLCRTMPSREPDAVFGSVRVWIEG